MYLGKKEIFVVIIVKINSCVVSTCKCSFMVAIGGDRGADGHTGRLVVNVGT